MATINGSNGTNGTRKVTRSRTAARLYSVTEPPSLNDFATLCSQDVEASKYPLAASFTSNVPIYQLEDFASLSADDAAALQDEWNDILLHGPGVFVAKELVKDRKLLERVNRTYQQIIEKEKITKHGGGDHFAASGKNDRIWNSFGKHCLTDPASFVDYYSNPFFDLIFGAWLGPAYRVTAQVNVVKPGGQAQMPHRDYHLGFQTADGCANFPRGMQVASQFLTLQGAVAHTDMPLESGPTRLLPFSQMFEEGFMAYRLPDFKEYFLDHYVSLQLDLGDGLFFNPALFHAAGENQTSDFNRSANLLQISSAFGKTMETIDTLPLVEACWDDLKELYAMEGLSARVKTAVAAIGDGYPFPTNLDRMPPRMDGMAPESEQELLSAALSEKKDKFEILQQLRKRQELSTA